MVDCTTNSYAHHRPIPPWTARTGRRDIARGRTYSRLGRGPGGVTDHHAARPTRGGHHCREVPRKDDTTATFSLRLERAKWAEKIFRLMDGILDMGLAVQAPAVDRPAPRAVATSSCTPCFLASAYAGLSGVPGGSRGCSRAYCCV
eukprot:COSAG02_NODE_25168_length_665_cov_0.380282_1_plen_145_part_10